MVEDRWSRLSEPSICQTSRSKKSLKLSYNLHVGGAKKFYSWAQTFTPFHLKFPCRDDSCQWLVDMDLSTNFEPLKDLLKRSKILTILHGLHEIGIQLMQSNILNRQLSLSGSGISRFFLPHLTCSSNCCHFCLPFGSFLVFCEIAAPIILLG